jgi:hypothetical protein
MGSVVEGIKKKGYFKAHKDANEAYVEQCDLVKQAKAHLVKHEETTREGTGCSKKFHQEARGNCCCGQPS